MLEITISEREKNRMTNLYEYKHPIINTELASSSVDTEPRKFDTLQTWEDVINDYEFQARCPIILKNSHRNKHFTYACHLKGCPFKILLSYSNGDNFYDNHSHDHNHSQQRNDQTATSTNAAAAAAAAAAASVTELQTNENQNNSNQDDETDTLIDVKAGEDNNNNTSTIVKQDRDNDVKKESDHENVDSNERKYNESDATDQNVSDAIAAAVAAVQHPNENSTKEKDNQNDIDLGVKVDAPSKEISKKDNLNKTDDSFNVDEIILASHGSNAHYNSTIQGPFIVTKIEPYHNHSLEQNLTLDKFVLTKIPRILQYDLNFDDTLEDIYQKSNHSLSKFKVSQFVDDSGLLDIIKHRYHLINEDITKKFTSLISRRVTTYKARFVLKKKKLGEYRDVNPDSYIGQSGRVVHTIVEAGNASIETQPSTTPSLEEAKVETHNGSLEEGTDKAEPTEMEESKEKTDNEILMSSNLDQAISQAATSNGEHAALSDEKDTEANSLHNNDNEEDMESHNDLADEKTVRAAAQAAISGESINNLKRTFDSVIGNDEDMEQEELDEDDLERYTSSKRNKMDQAMKVSGIDDNPLAGLDDMHDDKLPHDVAEQLRLLSSHFKDVEAVSLQNASVDNENDPDQEDDGNNEEDMNGEDEDKSKNEDISDENIQPELRGQ